MKEDFRSRIQFNTLKMDLTEFGFAQCAENLKGYIF